MGKPYFTAQDAAKLATIGDGENDELSGKMIDEWINESANPQ